MPVRRRQKLNETTHLRSQTALNDNNNNSYDEFSDQSSCYTSSIHCIKLTPTKPVITPDSATSFNPLLSEMAEPAYVAAQHGEQYAYSGDTNVTGNWDQSQWEQWQRQWQSWYAQQNTINQPFNNQQSSHPQEFSQERVQNGGWVSSTSHSDSTNSNFDYNYTQSQNFYTPEQSNLSHRQSISSSSVSSLTTPYSTNNTNYSHSNSNNSLVCEHRNAEVTQPYEAIYHYSCPDCERSGFYDTSGRVYSEEELQKEFSKPGIAPNEIQNGYSEIPEERSNAVLNASPYTVGSEPRETSLSETPNRENVVSSSNKQILNGSTDPKAESQSAWELNWGYSGMQQSNGYPYQDGWSSWGAEPDWGATQNQTWHVSENQKSIESSEHLTPVNGVYDDSSRIYQQNRTFENEANNVQEAESRAAENQPNYVSEISQSSNFETLENKSSSNIENGLKMDEVRDEADLNSSSSGVSNDCNVMSEPISETNPEGFGKPYESTETFADRSHEETVQNEMDVFDHINSDFQAAANIYSADFATEVYHTSAGTRTEPAGSNWNEFHPNVAITENIDHNQPSGKHISNCYNDGAFGVSAGSAPVIYLKSDVGGTSMSSKITENKTTEVNSNWSHDDRNSNFENSAGSSYGYNKSVLNSESKTELTPDGLPVESSTDREAFLEQTQGWSMDFEYDNEFESDFIVPDVTKEDIKDIEQQLNEENSANLDHENDENMQGGSMMQLEQRELSESLHVENIPDRTTNSYEDHVTEGSQNTQNERTYSESDYRAHNWQENGADETPEVKSSENASEANVEQSQLQLRANEDSPNVPSFDKIPFDPFSALVSTEITDDSQADDASNSVSFKEVPVQASHEQFESTPSEVPIGETKKQESVEQIKSNVSEIENAKPGEPYVTDDEGLMDHNVISMYSECIGQMKTVSQVYTERYYQWQASQFNQAVQNSDQSNESGVGSVHTSGRIDGSSYEAATPVDENVDTNNHLDSVNDEKIETRKLEEQNQRQTIVDQNVSVESKIEKCDLNDNAEGQQPNSQVSLECLNDSTAISGTLVAPDEHQIGQNYGDFSHWNTSEFGITVAPENRSQNVTEGQTSGLGELHKTEGFDHQVYSDLSESAAADSKVNSFNIEEGSESHEYQLSENVKIMTSSQLNESEILRHEIELTKGAEMNKEVKFSGIVDMTAEESSYDVTDVKLHNNDASINTSDVTFSSLNNETPADMNMATSEHSKTQKSFAVLNSIADPELEDESQTTEEKTVEIVSAQWDNNQWYDNDNTWSESRQVPEIDTSIGAPKVDDSNDVAASYSTGWDQSRSLTSWNDWNYTGGKNWVYSNAQYEEPRSSGSASQGERRNVESQELGSQYLTEAPPAYQNENVSDEINSLDSKSLNVNDVSELPREKTSGENNVSLPLNEVEIKPATHFEPNFVSASPVCESNEKVEVTPLGGNGWDMSSDWETNFDADVSNSVQIAYQKSSSEIEASIPQEIYTEEFDQLRGEIGDRETRAQVASIPRDPEVSSVLNPVADVRNADVPEAPVVDSWSGWNEWESNQVSYNQITNQWEHANTWDHSYYKLVESANEVKECPTVENATENLNYGQEHRESQAEVDPSFAGEFAQHHKDLTMSVEVESEYTVPELDPKTVRSYVPQNELQLKIRAKNFSSNIHHNEYVIEDNKVEKTEGWGWSAESVGDDETNINEADKRKLDDAIVNQNDAIQNDFGQNQVVEHANTLYQEQEEVKNGMCNESEAGETENVVNDRREATVPAAVSLDGFGGIESEMTVPGHQLSGWEDSWDDGWDVEEEQETNPRSNTAIEVTPLVESFDRRQPMKSAESNYNLQSSPLQATPDQDTCLEPEGTLELTDVNFTPPLSSVQHLKHLQSETNFNDSSNSASHETAASKPIDVKNLKISPSFALRKSCSRLPVSKLVMSDESAPEKSTLFLDENVHKETENCQNVSFNVNSEPPRKTNLPVIDGRKSLGSSDEKQDEIVKPTQRKSDIAAFEILPDKEKKIVKSHVPKFDESLDDISCVSTSSRQSKQKLPVSREIFGTPNDSNDAIEIHGIEPEESNCLLEVENVSHSETQCKQSEQSDEGNLVTTNAGSKDSLTEQKIIPTSNSLEPAKTQPLLATETFGYTFEQPKTDVPISHPTNFKNSSNQLSRNSSFTGSESNAVNYTQQNQYQQPQHNVSFPGVYPTSFTPDANFHPRPAPPILHPFMTPPPANLGAPLSVHVPPPMSPMGAPVGFQPNPMMMNHQMQMYYQWQLQNMYNSYIQNYMSYSQMMSRHKGTSPRRTTTRFASVSEMTSGSGNDTDNDEVSEINDNDAVNNAQEDETAENRQTPELFSRMHSVAKFSTNGRFVFTDNISAERSQLFHTSHVIPVPKAVREFPGPFNRDRSMKSDVRSYLSERLNDAQNENLKDLAILIKYLILLVESNGAVNGSAVAKILLGDESSNEIEDDEDLDDFDILESFEPTNESGRTLINSCDAELTEDDRINMVKFAMLGEENKLLQYTSEHNLWGFALRFSAFTQVSSTQRMIVELFDQKCIPGITNPLQTFISLKERRTFSPEFLRDCWKNWEQHVAIMLSNQTSENEYNQHCFMILGNALNNNGLNIAAQMCYILAGSQFSLPWEADSRLLLLGTNAESISAAMNDFDSIFLSLCFEFAVHLRHQAQDVCFPSLQHFKFLLAKQYVEFGLNTKAFEFCKDISKELLRNPDLFRTQFVRDVIELSNGLKYSIDNGSLGVDFISELETLMMPPALREPKHMPIIREVEVSRLDLAGQTINTGSLSASQQLDDQYFYNNSHNFDQSMGYPSNASDRLSKSSTLERPIEGYDSNLTSVNFETSVPVTEKLAPIEIDTMVSGKEHLGSEPGSPNVFADSSADLRYLQMAASDDAHFYSAPRMSNSALLNVNKSAVAFEMPSSTANMAETRSTFDPSLTEADYRKKYQDSQQTPKFKMQPYFSGSSNSVNSIGSPYRKRDNLFRESVGSEASEILSGVFDGSGNRSRHNSMHNYDKVQRSIDRPMSVSSDRSTYSLKYNTIIPESDEPNVDDRATPTNDMNRIQAADPAPKTATSSNAAARKESWLFTGVKNVLGKLMPLPNQMHLPDDKSSDFYWDPEKKKWVDTTKDGKEEELLPPPPMSDMMQPMEKPVIPAKDSSNSERPAEHPSIGAVNNENSSISANPVANVALLPPVVAPGNPFARGRGLAKSKYVDILANSKQVSQTSPGSNQPPPPTISSFMPGPFPPMPFTGEAPPFPMPDPEEDSGLNSGEPPAQGAPPPASRPVAASS